ncbi:MAG: LeuA family protein [Anaerolineae bacterium]|jgi:homocitrate synthase|nr:LeuA family protein [Anaerolineae bacterium]
MNSQNTFQFKHFQPRPLELIDTTLREGSHTSLLHDHYKYFFNQNDKMEIARALILYGVKFIELFAPIVSPQEREDFAAIKAVRDELIMQQGYTFLLAHVRCHPDDVESAIAAGADGLNLYIRLSDTARYSHGKDLETVIRRTRVLLADLSTNYPDLILRFSGEDAFRTSEENIFRVYDELLPYVHRFGTPDSVGVATPAGVAQRLRALRQRYPDVDFEGHFHDDRGFALANTLAAVQNGMRYVQTTLLGVGERSGITSMTALLFNLFIDKAYDHLKGYHLRDSYPINVMFASKLKKLVPSKEPVSLTNRTHTAGVHQKAMLAHTATYEAFPLDQFGVNESEVLLGPLSGWNIVHYFLKEIKYYNLDEGTARQIAAVFKERIYNLGPQDSPAEILLDIAENEFGLSRTAVPERFKDNIVQRLDVDEPADAHGISEAEGDPEARREAAISLKH